MDWVVGTINVFIAAYTKQSSRCVDIAVKKEKKNTLATVGIVIPVSTQQ